MILHAAFIQQHIPCIEVALENGPAVLWESRAGNGLIGAECILQRLCDRADIASVSRIERRAIFEIETLAPTRLQPLQRL